MNLFNKKVRKASEQLSISAMSPIRIKRDKEAYKCSYCKGDINRLAPHYQETDGMALYHTKCLTCHECKQDCLEEFYFTFKKINKHYLPTIYCKKDMNETCQSCGGSVEQGGLVTFLGYKYHEDHFRCAECGRVLSGDAEVFEFRKRLYCLRDFVSEYRRETQDAPSMLGQSGTADGVYAKYGDDEEYDSDSGSDSESERVGDFKNDNLDVRDFKNNDYSAKHCDGCGTMLLAGTNINEVRFRNSATRREYWHLDCFVLFKRYKVILSPKLLDPRRYIMFNKNAGSINLNTDLRNISQWLNLFFEHLESHFTSITNDAAKRDRVALFLNLKLLLARIQTLFNAVQNLNFIADDYLAKMKSHQYNESALSALDLRNIGLLTSDLANSDLINSDPTACKKPLESLNFSRYRSLKQRHTLVYRLYEVLLLSDMSEYDIADFNHLIQRVAHYLVGYSLHKILIYNYLTKENRLLPLFLSKLNADIQLLEDDNQDLPDRKSTDSYDDLNNPKSLLDDLSDPLASNIFTGNGINPSNSGLFLDPKCSKCGLDIKLESFIIQMPSDSDNEDSKIYRFHMHCVGPNDLSYTANVPAIIDAYGPGVAGSNSAMGTPGFIHTECVSVFDQTIDCTRRLLKRWYSRQNPKQPPSPIVQSLHSN